MGGVFLRRGDELVAMFEQRYELEDHLQELIERHPNLLAGDQVDPDAPRRWLLLSREAGVPDFRLLYTLLYVTRPKTPYRTRTFFNDGSGPCMRPQPDCA